MQKNIIIGVGIIVVVGSILFFTMNSKKSGPTVGGEDVLPITNNLSDLKKDTKKMTNAILHTSQGDITVELFEEQAPKTVANFTKLVKENFYSGVKFHRVIKGFMIQGGDPLTKDDSKINLWGTGGPGYKFADEIDPQSDLYTKVGYAKGVVAMANSGQNTNGSQFFIMAKDYPLPSLYTIFGKVVSGQEVVTKIENTPTTGEPFNRPITPVIIESISLK